MRKVKFNKPLQTEYCEGIFLDWGLSKGNTVALIELEDGSVEVVDLGRLKFVSERNQSGTHIKEDSIKIDAEAKRLIEKLGIDGAHVYCSQEMRDAGNSEHYSFLFKVQELIPIKEEDKPYGKR